MKMFSPSFEILPEPQKNIWAELSEIPKHFVLYGGTAIALRLNHRQSVDFDFFTSQPIEADALLCQKFLEGSQIIQQAPNTLTVIVDRNGPVKISFFGAIGVGKINPPELTRDGTLLVASMNDLFAHKLKVLLQRVEVKDYIDIAAMLKSGYSLLQGISGAKSLWDNLPVMECLRSLCYFEGGDFRKLLDDDRKIIINAVKGIKLDQLESVKLTDSLSDYQPPPA